MQDAKKLEELAKWDKPQTSDKGGAIKVGSESKLSGAAVPRVPSALHCDFFEGQLVHLQASPQAQLVVHLHFSLQQVDFRPVSLSS